MLPGKEPILKTNLGARVEAFSIGLAGGGFRHPKRKGVARVAGVGMAMEDDQR